MLIKTAFRNINESLYLEKPLFIFAFEITMVTTLGPETPVLGEFFWNSFFLKLWENSDYL